MTLMWTKERVEELLSEESFDEQATEKGLTKQQIKEVRENIWYKLYMLQNYKVTREMFIGSTMRWKSIELYQTTIRKIYKGQLDEYNKDLTNSVYSPNLIKYIKGLMDSGVEPYPVLEENQHRSYTSIQQLLNYDVLTPQEAKQIFESVGPKDNMPDTTVSGTRNVESHKIGGSGFQRDHYSTLTMFEKTNTNPILNNKNPKTPPKLFQLDFKTNGINMLGIFNTLF